MATYKLIQDIEAEDKILGPLTLRQFIFGLIAAFFGYFSFFVASRGAPFLLIVFGPPAIFFGFFAFPFGRDQPTEIWFLAKLRFWFLPRTRVWDQSGAKELVTITVPKKVERVLTDGLSQTEVKSRLQALANTIDSRGWAVKNVPTYAQPGMGIGASDDRLIDLSTMPQEVPDDTADPNDILDPANSALAYQVDTLVNQAAQNHRQQLISQLNAPASAMPQPAAQQQSAGWFTGHVSLPTPTITAPQVLPANDPNEAELAKQLKSQSNTQHDAYSHMRTMRPLGSQPVQSNRYMPAPNISPPQNEPPKVTPHNDPAIMGLAGNDDLNVATLAREAHKAKGDQPPTDEVVISLR